MAVPLTCFRFEGSMAGALDEEDVDEEDEEEASESESESESESVSPSSESSESELDSELDSEDDSCGACGRGLEDARFLAGGWGARETALPSSAFVRLRGGIASSAEGSVRSTRRRR